MGRQLCMYVGVMRVNGVESQSQSTPFPMDVFRRTFVRTCVDGEWYQGYVVGSEEGVHVIVYLDDAWRVQGVKKVNLKEACVDVKIELQQLRMAISDVRDGCEVWARGWIEAHARGTTCKVVWHAFDESECEVDLLGRRLIYLPYEASDTMERMETRQKAGQLFNASVQVLVDGEWEDGCVCFYDGITKEHVVSLKRHGTMRCMLDPNGWSTVPYVRV